MVVRFTRSRSPLTLMASFSFFETTSPSHVLFLYPSVLHPISLSAFLQNSQVNRPESHPLYDEAEQGSVRQVFKFDVAANRYDLLCAEGLTRALRIFLGDEKPPVFKKVPPKKVRKCRFF